MLSLLSLGEESRDEDSVVGRLGAGVESREASPFVARRAARRLPRALFFLRAIHRPVTANTGKRGVRVLPGTNCADGNGPSSAEGTENGEGEDLFKAHALQFSVRSTDPDFVSTFDVPDLRYLPSIKKIHKTPLQKACTPWMLNMGFKPDTTGFSTLFLCEH
jgi:hypothetical protein